MQKTMKTMSRSCRGILRLTLQSIAVSILMAPLSIVQAQTPHPLKLFSRAIDQQGKVDDNVQSGSYPWKNKRLEWYYNPAGQPAGVTTAQALATLNNAAAKWKSACGIDIVYMGTTSTASSLVHNFSEEDGRNVVGWGTFSAEHDCIATSTAEDLESCTARLYNSSIGQLLEIDVLLNTIYWQEYLPAEMFALDGAMTAVFGFMIGLDRTDNPDSVLTNDSDVYDNFHFARLLNGDDIFRCIAFYGSTPNTALDRVFNLFEVFLWGLNDLDWVGPIGKVTQTSDGWRYRTYPDHDTVIGEYNGQIYALYKGYLPYLMLGTVEQWMPIVDEYKF